MDAFWIIVSIILIILLASIFTIAYNSITGALWAMEATGARLEALSASVSLGNGTYYIEVVWTGQVRLPKAFILANGQSVKAGEPVECGVGLVPAPYRYCIYRLDSNIPPVGVLFGG